MASSNTTIYVKNDLLTEIHLHDTVSKSWEGNFDEKLWSVLPNKEGQFLHSGEPGSAAGVVYRVKNQDEKEWDIVFAWDNPSGNGERKIHCAIVDVIWDPNKWDWKEIREKLAAKDQLLVVSHGIKAHLAIEGTDNSATVKATISYPTKVNN